MQKICKPNLLELTKFPVQIIMENVFFEKQEMEGVQFVVRIFKTIEGAIHQIQELKTKYLGSKNPRLHTDETLIALSVSAADNPEARKALEQLHTLKGCQAHTSVMLSSVDIWEFRKLGIELTCEPKFEKEKKYH